MKFKMSERSLFATLLRARWWVSFLLAAVVALVAGALLPETYKIPGMLGAFPFLVIGMIAVWRQRHAISPARIETLVAQAQGMTWRDFALLIETALRQQGFNVTALHSGPADFRLEKQGRISLVSVRRWKAAIVGVEHLHELLQAKDREQALACSCMGLGRFSQSAFELAEQRDIQLLGPKDIAQLMHDGARAMRVSRS